MRKWLKGAGCATVILAICCLYGYLFHRLNSRHFDLDAWVQEAQSIAGHHALYMISLFAGVMLCVTVSIGLQTLMSRWKPINVFIAYQHKWKDIAAEIQSAVRGMWVKVAFLPFVDSADHDTVIDECWRKVRWSDVVIVLPGIDPAWVDYEVAMASGLFKVVILIRIFSDQRTPDPSFRGYPVFDLMKLRAARFRPLRRFIMYVSRLWLVCRPI